MPGFGKASLRAQIEQNETIPSLADLLFDISPKNVSPTQIAVAGALLFGENATTRLRVDGKMRHADVAELSQIVGAPVEPDADVGASQDIESLSELPMKVTSLRVTFTEELASETPGRDATKLTLIPSQRYFGGLLGIKESVIASNAWLHATYVLPARVLAAAGVLFANDFLAAGLILPDVPVQEKVFIAKLCRVVGLETIFEAI